MKYYRSTVSALAFAATWLEAYAQEDSGVPWAYENTGAACTAPDFPEFDCLPIVRPLPDRFLSFDATRDASIENWEKRRNEIKASIEKSEVGEKPASSDLSVSATPTPPVGGSRSQRFAVEVAAAGAFYCMFYSIEQQQRGSRAQLRAVNVYVFETFFTGSDSLSLFI